MNACCRGDLILARFGYRSYLLLLHFTFRSFQQNLHSRRGGHRFFASISSAPLRAVIFSKSRQWPVPVQNSIISSTYACDLSSNGSAKSVTLYHSLSNHQDFYSSIMLRQVGRVPRHFSLGITILVTLRHQTRIQSKGCKLSRIWHARVYAVLSVFLSLPTAKTIPQYFNEPLLRLYSS